MKIFQITHDWPHEGTDTYIFGNREKAIEFARRFRWRSPFGENESIEVHELELGQESQEFLAATSIPIYHRKDKRKS